ncbi:acyltransferase family protein (plasmid) [Lactiplantibacillus plantarum]|nr:acyltransferase family protein [Lactiplantibacillus plantarum]
MKKRIVLIDYLKGYSILTIVLMHLYQLFYLPQIGHQSNIIYKVSSFGGAGVHVFILCSGLGLALSHYHHRLSVFNFIKKRFTRVYIPYIIVVALTALVPFFPYLVTGSMPLPATSFSSKCFPQHLSPH